MRWFRTFCALGLLAAQATAAAAADMPGTTMPEPEVWRAPQLLESNLGWYLRGDVGWAWGRLDSTDSPPTVLSPSQNSLGNNGTSGGGFGFKSQWLRTDVTIDYLGPLNYTGGIYGPGDVVANISAISALFNGYVDLGTWYQITPYIGAGAGAAYMRVSDYASTVAGITTSDTHNQWNFAWAAMAGVAFPVAHNLMVDVGYRYMNFGDVSTEFGALGEMTFKNVAAHEVRVGVRWSFDDLW